MTGVVTDEETGVTTQDDTHEHALERLDEAVALHTGEASEPVTDDDLRERGLDPEAPDESDVTDPPRFDADERRLISGRSEFTRVDCRDLVDR